MKIVYLNYMWDLWGLSIGSTIKALELLRALKACGHEVKEYWQNDDFNRKSGENLESPSQVRNFLKDHFKYYLHEP
ncbi:hypothetical protein L0128_22815, partial [candidate division KSB1 bacterium]|nr:hypothetical protein [candidate division KSB1 bacterium]